jgi:hypothetical protein
MQSNAARIGVLGAVLAVAVVLFIVLNGGDDNNDNGGSGGSTTTTATVPQVITVRDGAPVGGVQTINATKGQPVSFTVDLDQPAEEVHVHGLEIEKPAENPPVKMSFTPDLDGIFEIELHENGGGEFQIGELKVEP